MSGTISKTSDATVPLSFSAAIEHLCEHIRQGIESCIPAQFVEYDDRDKGLAIVYPLVKFPYVSGNKTVWKERPQFTVRVLRVKSGGFWFEMPLKKGDTGWIIAADRDTSFAISRNANVDESKNTKENGGGPQEYSNFNKLKYSFGFFLPDSYCNLKVKEGHEESSFWAMLKDDGSGETDSYIELKKDGDIVLHGSGEWERVLVEGNIGVTGDLETRGTMRAEAGSGDPVEVLDTKFLVPLEEDMYSVWNGKVFRSKGVMGEPFKLKGGGEGDEGEGGEGEDDLSDGDIAVDPDRFVTIDDMEIYASVREDEDSGATLIGVTTISPEDTYEYEDTYCNDISDDDDGNDISSDSIGPGGGGPSGGSGDPENFISRWPCKKDNDDLGGNDL